MSEFDDKPDHWKDDKLDRYDQAKLLKGFLDQQYKSEFRSEDGTKSFVLNLDAEWGYGKTFFLNRFAKDLGAEHIVLRYNAWANDYAKDPLLSFISQITLELIEQLDKNGTSAEDNANRKRKFVDSALKVIKSAGKAAAPKLLTAGVSTLVLGFPILAGYPTESEGSDDQTNAPSFSEKDQENVTRTIGASVEAAMASVESNLFEEENSRRAAVGAFHSSLTDIVSVLTEQTKSGEQTNSKKAPVFILIDELDRCRPDFTIELIECVKHLFSVDGLYFIFATDGRQLQAALNGLYGENFDAEIYFNRIFNKEIGLHIPDQRKVSEALINEYGLSTAAQDYDLILYAIDPLNQDSLSLVEDFRIVSEFFGLDLRSQKQLLSSFHTLILARKSLGLKTHSIPTLCLIVFWQRKKSFFRKLRNVPHTIHNAQDIEKDLRSIMSDGRYDLSVTTQSKDFGNRHHFPNSNVPIPTILMSFIQMSSHKPVDYLKQIEGTSARTSGTEAFYIGSLKREVQAAGADGLSRNPLINYFDQITMVS